MYRCQSCGAQTPKGQQLVKAFTYRKKTYHNQTYKETSRTTKGTEIASEKRVCTKCAVEGATNEE
jgi:hypothetical protein